MKRYIVIFIIIISVLISYTDKDIDTSYDIGELFQFENQEEVEIEDTEDEELEQVEEETPDRDEKFLNMENQMIDLVNQERVKNGLNNLELDEELRDVARIKSEDIAKYDYFDHTSPRYGSPFEMMEEFGIEYTQAAENLAGHQSVEEAHIGLMNSKGHRENILLPGLTHIGIGITSDDKYKYIFTQMFITKR